MQGVGHPELREYRVRRRGGEIARISHSLSKSSLSTLTKIVHLCLKNPSLPLDIFLLSQPSIL